MSLRVTNENILDMNFITKSNILNLNACWL